MTRYSGIIFYILLEITLLYTIIYFYKTSLLLSILFSIAAIVTCIFICKEYTFHQHNQLIIEEETTPEVIHIKHSLSGRIINILGYSTFIIVCFFYLIALSKKTKHINNTSIFTLIMSISIIIFFIIMIIKEIKHSTDTFMSISNDGIEIKKGLIMNWSDIELEKVIVKYIKSKESRHDHRVEINYLYFFYKGEKVEIKIDEVNITDYNLARYLKIYRERFNKTNQSILM